MSTQDVVIGLLALADLGLVFKTWRLSRRNRDTRDELSIQRPQNMVLREDVPFPRGEQLP